MDRSLFRIISGLDWLLDKFNESENSEPPAVLNMSLGFRSIDIQSSANRQKLEILQNRLIKCVEKLNVLPIIAIGNHGQGMCNWANSFAIPNPSQELKIANFSPSDTDFLRLSFS